MMILDQVGLVMYLEKFQLYIRQNLKSERASEFWLI